MDRPTYKEIDSRLRKAMELASQKQILLLNTNVIAEDAIELGYQISKLTDIICEILKEVTPKDYVGQHPPTRSYEEQIRDLELFAFRWNSTKFGCETYLKFTVTNDALYIVSLHQNRQK